MLTVKRMNIRPTEIVAALLIVAGFAMSQLSYAGRACWSLPSNEDCSTPFSCIYQDNYKSCFQCDGSESFTTACIFHPTYNCVVGFAAGLLICGEREDGTCLGAGGGLSSCTDRTPTGFNCMIVTGCTATTS